MRAYFSYFHFSKFLMASVRCKKIFLNLYFRFSFLFYTMLVGRYFLFNEKEEIDLRDSNSKYLINQDLV